MTAVSVGPLAGEGTSRAPRRTVALIGLVVLLWIGYVLLLPEAPHGDGLRWTGSIEAHAIDINPNYLLMQPAAVAGFRVWEALGLPTDANLYQKYLDSLAGAAALLLLALTLLHLGVRTRVAALALVLCALSFNFLYLATSDHIKLLTAPFLVAVLLFVARHSRTRRRGALVLAGIAMALAVATMISAVVWAALLGVAIAVVGRGAPRERLTDAVIFWLAAAVPATILFVGTYIVIGARSGFIHWMTTYGADAGARDVGFTGVSVLTLGRAAFALVKNFAYSTAIGPMVKSLLVGADLHEKITAGGVLDIAATLAVIVLLAMAVRGLWRARRAIAAGDGEVLAACVSAVLAFGLFATLWNSGEEEFWFQITAPTAIVVALWMTYRGAAATDRMAFAGCIALIAASNLLTFALPRRAYPFDDYVSEIVAAVEPADLVVYDNSEPVGLLMYGVRKREKGDFIAITTLMERQRYDLDVALARLRGEIEAARARGGRIFVFDVFDASSFAHPWSLLSERFGIGPEPFISLLRSEGDFRRATLAGRTVWILDPPGDQRGVAALPPPDQRPRRARPSITVSEPAALIV